MEKHTLTPEEQAQKEELEKKVKASKERLKLIARQEKLNKQLTKLDKQRAEVAAEIEALRVKLTEPIE